MFNIKGLTMVDTNQSLPSTSLGNLDVTRRLFKRNDSNTLNTSSLAKNATVTEAYAYKLPVEVVVTFFCVIFIVGLIGNSIVVLIVVKKRRMQTFTNWLILNLAIADLLVALICIPLEIPLEIKGGLWIYGEGFCTVFYPIQTATIYGSVFTLVALSSSRYWAIIHPFRRQPNVRTAKVFIGIIWICSVIVVIPYMVTLKYENGSCIETWTARQSLIYTIALFTFQFILPILIISIAYAFIIRELCYKKKDTVINADKVKQSEAKKVVKLLLIITVTFAVCILPYQIMALLSAFGLHNLVHFNEFNLGSYFLLYLNSALNPIIYNAFNESFRESFHELYKTIFACLSNKSAGLEGDFFSKRRPSKFQDQLWQRFSVTQSASNRTSVTSDGNRTATSFVGSVYQSPSANDDKAMRCSSSSNCAAAKCNAGSSLESSSPVFL